MTDNARLSQLEELMSEMIADQLEIKAKVMRMDAKLSKTLTIEAFANFVDVVLDKMEETKDLKSEVLIVKDDIKLLQTGFQALDQKVGLLDSKVTAIDNKMDQKFGAIDQRFDGMDAKFNVMSDMIAMILTEIKTLKK